MDRTMIAINALGLIMMLVLIVCNSATAAYKATSLAKGARITAFNLLACTNAFYLAVDILTYLFEGNAACTLLLYILNFIDFTGGLILALVFMYYVSVMLTEKGFDPSTELNSFIVWSALIIFVILLMLLAGGLFRIVDGQYVSGRYYFLIELISMIPLLFLFKVIFQHFSALGRDEVTAMIIYLLFPVVGVVLEFFYDDYTFVFISSSFSILVVYAMLQSSRIAEAGIRETLIIEFARRDMLTGLMNRTAFNEDIFSGKLSGNGAVIFCDCNRLKYTNDNFGHKAGDELLKKTAAILVRHFGEPNSYRISGDEFVAILTGHDETDSLRLVGIMMSDCDENDNIASVGFAYGDLADFLRLENDAESMMYRNKKTFHESCMPDYVDERLVGSRQ